MTVREGDMEYRRRDRWRREREERCWLKCLNFMDSYATRLANMIMFRHMP